ncbi:MAG: hypothetical protein V4548_12865 [Bacteroidota bacterium]
MKTKIITLSFFAFLFGNQFFAQDRTTVNANSQEISDNLDLKAVASIFGDSQNLDDFERRLNDPKVQISNLDLNNDNQVDYLRVIESVEDNTHLIIVQAVLEKDVFQDVATIEVERDNNNRVQVQVVGDVYMYGNNYIYEPLYVSPPIIYTTFWSIGYHPYHSGWYWGYYPSYYYAWNPYPIYRYRRNIGIHINHYHHYNYVNVRRSQRAIAMYGTRRSNGYEVQHPNRSFAQRNTRVSNRYELDQTRGTRNTRSQATTPRGNRNENASPRVSTRTQSSTPRGNRTESSTPRVNTRTEVSTPRGNRTESSTPRVNTRTEVSTPRGNRTESSTPRGNTRTEASTPRGNRTESSTPRGNARSQSSSPRGNNQVRTESSRGNSHAR